MGVQANETFEGHLRELSDMQSSARAKGMLLRADLIAEIQVAYTKAFLWQRETLATLTGQGGLDGSVYRYEEAQGRGDYDKTMCVICEASVAVGEPEAWMLHDSLCPLSVQNMEIEEVVKAREERKAAKEAERKAQDERLLADARERRRKQYEELVKEFGQPVLKETVQGLDKGLVNAIAQINAARGVLTLTAGMAEGLDLENGETGGQL